MPSEARVPELARDSTSHAMVRSCASDSHSSSSIHSMPPEMLMLWPCTRVVRVNPYERPSYATTVQPSGTRSTIARKLAVA